MKEIELLEYSNPRKEAIIEGWPWGQKLRTCARFYIEANKYGERAGRVLVDPKTGRDCAPKFTTYAQKARIVDGSDGRTYIATLGQFNFSIQIVCGDMKYTREYPPAGNAGTPEHARHAQILALFNDAPTDPPQGGKVDSATGRPIVQRAEARGGCVLGVSDAVDSDDFGGRSKLDKERADILAEANAEGRDITLAEGLDVLRAGGAQVLVIDEDTDFSKLPKFADLFGAPAAQGEPIKGTSGEGGAA